MANPGVVFLAFVLAVMSVAIGLSALTDGRNVQGGIHLLLALGFVGWGVVTLRKRRNPSR